MTKTPTSDADTTAQTTPPQTAASEDAPKPAAPERPEEIAQPEEIGGRKGPEPTRYGDWEKNGIISDF